MSAISQRNARCLPDRLSDCAWEATSGTSSNLPRLSGDHVASLVVVGAGFAGLAAARRLAEHFPDRKVILVDALQAGTGNSGRNSGFVVSLGHFSRHWTVKNHRRLYRIGLAGLHSLKRLVRQYGINCDWNDRGRLIAAGSRTACRSLDHMQRILGRLDSPQECLTGNEVRDLTGMAGYRQAIRQVESALVQPARLVTGLAMHLPSNVTLYEESPVTGIQQGKLLRLDFPNGTITTNTIVLTTNAWVTAFGMAANRVFPMRTFASVARVTGQANGGVDRDPAVHWGLTSAERTGSSFRSLPQRRILIRNTAAAGFRARDPRGELREIAKFHLESLQRSRGADKAVELENTWSGILSVTRNGAGFFGQLQPRVWSVTGHNGHGIAHGTAAGLLLADRIAGQRSALTEDILRLPKPAWIPRGPALHLGVAAALRYFNWRGRNEP